MFRVSKSRFVVVIIAFINVLLDVQTNVAEGWSFLNHSGRRETASSKMPKKSSLWNRKDTISAVAIMITSGGVGCISPSNANEEQDGPQLSDEERQQRQEELKQRILERRKLMEASRSSNNRQSYLDLSRQRAALYNTTFQGVTCPPNVPCL